MAVYSIKDLEKLSGIKAHTIRIWEKRYNLVIPQRTSTNIRYYTDNDLKKLLNISILNRNGLKISKIAELDNNELAEQISNLTKDAWNTENQLENLIIAMVEMDEKKFDKLLTKSIMQLGFEDTIIKIVYPFFIRIGVMWQTGSINPAQEHFVSNLVRQKLLVAIDSLSGNELSNAHRFICYLPEGELHELALLFLSYILKKRGQKVIYLGQSVPLKDVMEVNIILPAEFVVTYFTAARNEKDIELYLKTLSRSFKSSTVLVAGSQIEKYNKKLPSNIMKISSPEHFAEVIDRLS